MDNNFNAKYAFAFDSDEETEQPVQVLKWEDSAEAPELNLQPLVIEEVPQKVTDAVHEQILPALIEAEKVVQQQRVEKNMVVPVKVIEEIKKKNDSLSKFFDDLLSSSDDEYEGENSKSQKDEMKEDEQVQESKQQAEQIIEEQKVMIEEVKVEEQGEPEHKHEEFFEEVQVEVSNNEHEILEPLAEVEQIEETHHSEQDYEVEQVYHNQTEEENEFVDTTNNQHEDQPKSPKDMNVFTYHQNHIVVNDFEISQEPQYESQQLVVEQPEQAVFDYGQMNGETYLDLSTEVSLSIKPFEDHLHISDIPILDQIDDQPIQPSLQPKQESTNIRPKLCFAFPRSSHSLIISKQSGSFTKIPLHNPNDTHLFNRLHDMIKLDPTKIAHSEYARSIIASQISLYIEKSTLGSEELKVWRLFGKILTLRRSETLTQMESLVREHQDSIIRDLMDGREMQKEIGEMLIGTDCGREQIEMSKAFDYGHKGGWKVNYEVMVNEMMRVNQNSMGLLLASLLMDEQKKKIVYKDFIKQSIPIENPLHTLVIVNLGFGDELILPVSSMNWRTHVAFLIANWNNPQLNHHFISDFITKLADNLLIHNKDTWAFLYVKMMTFTKIHYIYTNSPCTSLRMNLSINYLIQLYSPIIINGEPINLPKLTVELNFYRALIYSKILQKHDLAHEEFHNVIEHREVLDPKLVKSQYFQFILRELKSQEFEQTRRNHNTEQKVIEKQVTPSQVASEHRQQEEQKTVEVAVDQGAFFSGFKGLFKRVIGNQMTSHVNQQLPKLDKQEPVNNLTEPRLREEVQLLTKVNECQHQSQNTFAQPKIPDTDLSNMTPIEMIPKRDHSLIQNKSEEICKRPLFAVPQHDSEPFAVKSTDQHKKPHDTANAANLLHNEEDQLNKEPPAV